MSWRNSDVLQTSKGATANRYFIVTSDTVIEMLYLEYKCTVQAKHIQTFVHLHFLDNNFTSYLHNGDQYIEILEFDVLIFQ